MSGAPLDRVKALLAALPKEEQAELYRYLDDILVSEDEARDIQVASLTDTRTGMKVTYTFRQEHVRCGKEACWCSAGGLGHGPYTYKYWKEKGKLRKEYVRGPGGPAKRRARNARAKPPLGPAAGP